jgi:two-component system, LuxR family, response regulator FixJ
MPNRKAIHNTLGHVVVVDDDPSVRQSVHTLLKREGYRVSVYDSADAFLQNLEFHTPTVLLTDVRMPGMSGVDLQGRLKALGHDLPMVFVSGESRQEEIIAAMKHGAIDFLLKPFTAQAMLDALQRAMHMATERLAQANKANQVSELLKRLTPRELEVCHWMVRGYSNQQISAVDGAAAATIKLHRSRVMEKMQANTLPELIETLRDIELPAPAPELNASESRVLD